MMGEVWCEKDAGNIQDPCCWIVGFLYFGLWTPHQRCPSKVLVIASKIVKPWSKSMSKPLSQQTPKSNKSPPKKEKKKDLDLWLTLESHHMGHHLDTLSSCQSQNEIFVRNGNGTKNDNRNRQA